MKLEKHVAPKRRDRSPKLHACSRVRMCKTRALSEKHRSDGVWVQSAEENI
jgi:hypothetical protein